MSTLIKLAVVASLLGLLYAMEKPCCVSKKWTGKMKITTAYLVNGSTVPVITDNRLMFDYDRDMRMERAVGTVYTVNGTTETTQNYTVYNDYRHMKKYTMGDMNKCNVAMITEDQTDPCVPSTLQHTGTYRLGSVNGATMVNVWEGVFKNFRYTMATTSDDCTPITMTRFGTDDYGTRISESVIYADIIQYTISPDAFNLPSACKTGDVAVGK